MPTVTELVTRYLTHSKANKVHCAEARDDRERTFRLFLSYQVDGKGIGEMDVSQVKPFMLTDFVESCESWRSTSTRRSKANAIRAAFEWAAEQGRIGQNPFRLVIYAEAERRPNLPDETLATVCTLANKRFEEALRFLRLTACRLSELCGAEWPDLDLDRGVWTLDKHKSRKRTGKVKVLPLVPEAVNLLREIKAQQELAGTVHVAVFVNNRGTPWTRRTLGQQLYRMKERHGIKTDASLHGIRHMAATAAVKAGAPLKHVSLMLGHASTAVTERFYVHDDALIDEAREAMLRSLPAKQG